MDSPVELNELMERIRSLSAAPRADDGTAADASTRPVGPALPPTLDTPTAPTISPGDDRERVAFDLASTEAASMLPRAREKTEVSASVPKMLRSLYRNQGGFNGILLEALERVLGASQNLQRETLQLQARLEALEAAAARQHEWMAAAASAQERNREWMAAVESYLLELGGSHEEVELRLRMKHANSAVRMSADNHHDEWLTALQEQVDKMDNHHHERLTTLQEQIDKVDSHADRLGDHLKNLQAQSDDQAQRLGDWHAQRRRDDAQQDSLQQNSRRLEERQHNDASYFKNQLWFLERLIQPLLARPEPVAPIGKDHASAASGAPTVPGGVEHEFDALYLAFEDVMRGSRDEVKKRVAVYLPYLTAANAGTAERPVLDLGCGRGEWLELLREHELTASGVDLNTCMVELCRERGLPITFADAIEHLRGLPDASCGAVTAFHLIEHLSFPVLVMFLRESRRVLQPGGVAIFETPNPYNVLVGSGFFYHDFTHQRPLPPNSTKFLVEQLGFTTVEVLPLHPWEEAAKVHGDGAKALEWRFNELFYGPQDYALIARV